jgi:hypothetical protein
MDQVRDRNFRAASFQPMLMALFASKEMLYLGVVDGTNFVFVRELHALNFNLLKERTA